METTIPQALITPSLAERRSVFRRMGTHSSTTSTARLTRRLQQGDESAFREFHRRYFDRLYHFLLVVSRGQEHEAKEALQETLVRVVRHARVHDDEEALWCWLKTVARNAARDRGRKQSRYVALLERFKLAHASHRESPAPAAEVQLRDVLAECLDELPDEDRLLVEGKYREGKTIRELAQDAPLTEKAVESRLGRLRVRLRAAFLTKLNEP